MPLSNGSNIPITEKVFFLFLNICKGVFEFDLQSPLSTPGDVWTKNLHGVTSFEIRIWIGKKHPHIQTTF